MANLPYVTVTKRLKPFFQKIQGIRKPAVVDRKWLQSIGFGSKNEAGLVSLLRVLGFVDGAGKPTARWVEYRDGSTARQVLAASIREGYAELFRTHPKADAARDADVRSFFKSTTGLSDYTVGRAVGTFRVLCKMADFKEAKRAVASREAAVAVAATEVGEIAAAQTKEGPGGLTVHVHILVSLPDLADEQALDKLFKALKKHISV